MNFDANAHIIDLTNKFKGLELSSLSSANQVNHATSIVVNNFFVQIAKSYGYIIKNKSTEVEEAKEFLSNLYFEVMRFQKGRDLKNSRISIYDESHDFCRNIYKSTMKELFDLYAFAAEQNGATRNIKMLTDFTGQTIGYAYDSLGLLKGELAPYDDTLNDNCAKIMSDPRPSKLLKRSLILIGLMKNTSNIEWHKASLNWALENGDSDLILAYIKRPDHLELFTALDYSLLELVMYFNRLVIANENLYKPLNELISKGVKMSNEPRFFQSGCTPLIHMSCAIELFKNLYSISEQELKEGLQDRLFLKKLIHNLEPERRLDFLKRACLFGSLFLIEEVLDYNNINEVAQALDWVMQSDEVNSFKQILSKFHQKTVDRLEDIHYGLYETYSDIDQVYANESSSFLSKAATYDSSKILHYLIKARLPIDDSYTMSDADRVPYPCKAVWNYNENVARLFMEDPLDYYDMDQRSIFHYIADTNQFELLEEVGRHHSLDEIQEIINKIDVNGRTPLSLAVEKDSIETVKSLVKCGAKLNVFNKTSSVLFEALKYGSDKTFKWLWENKKFIRYISDNSGNTLMHKVASCGESFFSDLVLSDASFNFEAYNFDLETAFDITLKEKNYGIALSLINKGVKPSTEANSTLSALESVYFDWKISDENQPLSEELFFKILESLLIEREVDIREIDQSSKLGDVIPVLKEKGIDILELIHDKVNDL